jgi:hypothetical protein
LRLWHVLVHAKRDVDDVLRTGRPVHREAHDRAIGLYVIALAPPSVTDYDGVPGVAQIAGPRQEHAGAPAGPVSVLGVPAPERVVEDAVTAELDGRLGVLSVGHEAERVARVGRPALGLRPRLARVGRAQEPALAGAHLHERPHDDVAVLGVYGQRRGGVQPPGVLVVLGGVDRSGERRCGCALAGRARQQGEGE